MCRTISNHNVLILFLALAIPVVGAGCAGVPPQNVAPLTAVQNQKASAPKPATASVPTEQEPAKPASAPAPVRTVVANDNTITAGVDEPAQPVATKQTDTTADDEQQPAASADNSIWTRLRSGFRLPKMDSSFTRPHEQWFVENTEFREAMFERSKMYLYYIVEEVEKRGLPMEIALLPAIESAYKPYAYSRAKASGLWQFIASTGKLYGLKSNWWYDGRRDVIASTRAALDYLEKLHDDFDGDWQLALAAYNAGEGRIARAMEWNRRKGLPTDFASLKKLKAETRQYVPKLMAVVNMVTDPQRFGIQLPDVPNEPYFTTVETDSQVDLGVIARLTGMEVDALHFINPGYTRWATDPNGPHKILVPVNKKEALLAGLSALPDNERVQWLHHEVRRGDTLSSIARHYNLPIAAVKASNKGDGPLRVGQDLLLPISAMAKFETPAAPKAKAIRASAKPNPNQPLIHKVRAGETLTSIARRYNVLVQQLAEWNRMRPNDVLTRGRRLRIWPNDGPQASSALLSTSIYV